MYIGSAVILGEAAVILNLSEGSPDGLLTTEA